MLQDLASYLKPNCLWCNVHCTEKSALENIHGDMLAEKFYFLMQHAENLKGKIKLFFDYKKRRESHCWRSKPCHSEKKFSMNTSETSPQEAVCKEKSI